MTVTRIVRPGRVVGLALVAGGLLAGGCGKPGANPKPRAEPETPNTIVTPGGATAAPTPPVPPGQDQTPAAEAFAREFLTALDAGAASPAQLTDDFKRIIAPPVLTADREKGFSDLFAADWLKRFAGQLKADPLLISGALGTDVVVITATSTVEDPRAHREMLLRVVRFGAEWRIDWLHQMANSGVGLVMALENLEREHGFPKVFAVHAFMSTVAIRDFDLAEALIAPGAKKRLAPSLGGEDDARGYNRSILRNKLARFRGDAASYADLKWDLGETAGTVAGEWLDGLDRKRPFALKLVRGPKPAEWLVDDFDPR